MRIINEGDAVVRLLGREWRIHNADGSLHASVPRRCPLNLTLARARARAPALARALALALTPSPNQVPRGSPGVVGETPTLGPGQAFEYASGTTLDQRARMLPSYHPSARSTSAVPQPAPEVSAVGSGGAGRSWPEAPSPLRTWGSERALSRSGRPLGNAAQPQGLAKAPPRRHLGAT